jgi:hypothetical protein
MQEGKVQIKYRQRRLTTCKTWESVRMANAEVNGRQTTREAEPDNYLPSLSKETTPIPRLVRLRSWAIGLDAKACSQKLVVRVLGQELSTNRKGPT